MRGKEEALKEVNISELEEKRYIGLKPHTVYLHIKGLPWL